MSAAVASAPTNLGVRLRRMHPVLNVVLALVAVFWLVPTVGLLVISFRPEGLFTVSGWWTALTAPSQLTFENYQAIFAQGFKPSGLVDSVVTSLVITVPSTVLVTLLSSLTAYSLVFGRWRGRDAVLMVVVALLVVPLQIALLPVSALYGHIHDVTGFNPYGTALGVVIFHVAFGLPFGIFLMRNFYTGIPRDLLEAARIDGAGEWTLFRRVVIPLGLPAAASLGIFQFIWTWNDLLVGLVFLGASTHITYTYFLYNQTRTFAASYWVISTGAIIALVIPLIVFFSFQRYFVRGVLAGAVK